MTCIPQQGTDGRSDGEEGDDRRDGDGPPACALRGELLDDCRSFSTSVSCRHRERCNAGPLRVCGLRGGGRRRERLERGEPDDLLAKIGEIRAARRHGVQCSRQGSCERRGDRRAERRRRLQQLAGEQRLDSFVRSPAEERLACRGLEQRRSEAIYVAPRSLRLAAKDLWRHMFGCEGDAVRRRLGFAGEEAGDAEIAELHLTVARQQDIAGLHVSMKDPDGVRCREGIGNSDPDLAHRSRRHRTLLGDDVGQGPAIHVLRHEVRLAGGRATGGVHVEHVQMARQLCDRSRLTLERSPDLGVLDLPAEHLDRDLPLQRLLARQVHGRCTTSADGAQDGEPVEHRSASYPIRWCAALRAECGVGRHGGRAA